MGNIVKMMGKSIEWAAVTDIMNLIFFSVRILIHIENKLCNHQRPQICSIIMTKTIYIWNLNKKQKGKWIAKWNWTREKKKLERETWRLLKDYRIALNKTFVLKKQNKPECLSYKYVRKAASLLLIKETYSSI